MASHNKTSWSPGYYQYDDRQLFEHLQGQTHLILQFSDQLQAYPHIISTVSQRISEKNLIINNLQHNFNKEREVLLGEIEKYKWKLVVEKQKAKSKACKCETSNSEQAEQQCKDSGAEMTKPIAEPEQIEERTSKSPKAERHKVQHRTLLPKPPHGDSIEVLAPQDNERAASPNSQAVETESWQSARETMSPVIKFMSPQEPTQTQGTRKRKRAPRS
ncbi:hypothetical protein ACJQWK_04398 [Exserohilum turcicum]